MTDRITRAKRSENMSRIRGWDTGPEMQIRHFLHRNGFRYRLHAAELPGKPDVVLPRYQTVVLVHGCFWHRHQGCRLSYQPKSNVEFWEQKFAGNQERDERNQRKLQELGWRVEVVWQCEAADRGKLLRLRNRIRKRG